MEVEDEHNEDNQKHETRELMNQFLFLKFRSFDLIVHGLYLIIFKLVI